jgi:putative ABC transport system permease protein
VTRWLRTTFQPFRALGPFSLLWLITLAIGIAVATVSFTQLSRTLLDRLALPKPNQLYVITRESMSQSNQGLSKGLIEEIRIQKHIDIAGTLRAQQRISGAGISPQQVQQLSVMPQYFRVLSVKPMLGIRLDAKDADSDAVMISYALWRELFDSDPNILSRTIQLGGEDKRIIGVLPRVMQRVADEDVYAVSLFDNMGADTEFNFRTIARRYQDLSESEFVSAIGDALDTRRERTNQAYSANTRLKVENLKTARTAQVRDMLQPILALVALLFVLMACNAASLFSVSVLERIHGLAIESAMGATLFGMLRQMLWQSFVFTVFAALIAAPFCPALFTLAHQYFLQSLPMLLEVQFDWRIWLLVTLLFSVLNAAAAFLPAAFILRRSSLNRSDRTIVTTQGARFARTALAFQLVGASAVILLSVLMIRSLQALNAINPGFALPRLMTASLVLPNRTDTGKAEKDIAAQQANLEFLVQLQKNLSKIEGIHSVSFASEAPLLEGRAIQLELRLEGVELANTIEPLVTLHAIDSSFADALGITLLEGRLPVFKAESAEQEAAVNLAYVKRYANDQDILGREVEGRNVRIVGVLANYKNKSLAADTEPALYVPIALDFLNEIKLLARVQDGYVLNADSSLALAKTITDSVHRLEPNVPISNFKNGELVREGSLRDRIGLTRVLWSFSILSIATVTLGLFSLGAYSVTKRKREFGLRAAFGATPSVLMRQVVTENLRFSCYCVIAGLIIGSFLSNLISSKLYRLTWMDGISALLTLALMIGVCLLAALIPAWRAAKVMPTKNLRGD